MTRFAELDYLQNYADYLSKLSGLPFPLVEVKAATTFNGLDRVSGSNTPDAISRHYLASVELLEKLEEASAQRGGKFIQLETGPFQPQAIAFYKKQGFDTCAAFGEYPEHPFKRVYAEASCKITSAN